MRHRAASGGRMARRMTHDERQLTPSQPRTSNPKSREDKGSFQRPTTKDQRPKTNDRTTENQILKPARYQGPDPNRTPAKRS